METKNEELLSRVVVDHLFLSQFEPFRACLRSLYEINGALALGILQAVIRSGGRLTGVLWSDTVLSSSHLAWLCLGELSGLEAKRRFSSRGKRALSVLDPGLIVDNVEFLLLVELLARVSTTRASTLSKESDTKLWELGQNEFRKFGRNVSSTTSSSVSGKSRKGKGISPAVGSPLFNAFDGVSTERRRFSDAEATIEITGTESQGAITQGAVQEEAETNKGGRGQAPGLSGDSTPCEAAQAGTTEDMEKIYTELESAGIECMQELSATGLERLNVRLKLLDLIEDLPRNAHELINEDFKPEAAHRSSTVDRNADSTAQGVQGSEGRTENSGSSSQPQGQSDSLLGRHERSCTLTEKHRIWVTKLTLYHPDLLHALCCNIRRQHYFNENRVRLDKRSVDEESRNEFSFEADPDYQAHGPGSREKLERTLLEQVEEDKFELGLMLSKEVQSAHLEQMKQDIREGRLARAIQHVRYLQSGGEIADSQYGEVMHLIIKKVKKNVDPGKPYRERYDDASLLGVYEQVMASSCLLLSSLAESVQDGLILEVAEEKRVAAEQILPAPLEKLHKQLELRRALTSTTNVTIDPLWIRSCRIEMFHYARVMGGHVLETVMEAAFSSIRNLQFQKAADVLASYPRLQSLATVMGWDLLAGETSGRRRLMEVLWINKQKSARLEGGSAHGRTDEISCIEEICEQLCYRLELAYYVALVNSGVSWQSGRRKVFGTSSGKAAEQDGPGADPFVANLVLERLAMHSPLRVIFDVVPNIKVQDAMQLIEMQPVGSSTNGLLQRQQDLELLHMHFGLQAAIHALSLMEASAIEDQRDQVQRRAKYFLSELRQHLNAVVTPARKLWMMNIIKSLLHMEELSPVDSSCEGLRQWEDPGSTSEGITEGDKSTALTFIGEVLLMLRQSLSSLGLEVQGKQKLRQGMSPRAGTEGGFINLGVPDSVFKAWKQNADSIQDFVDDWEWRLAVLQRLSPSSQRQWQWLEALAVLRAAPSTLLNMCVQRAQYDLGEEAVHRFGLPPEEAASLQLAEWVDGAVARSVVDDSVSLVGEGASTSDEVLNAVLRSPLPPLASVLLCLDVAAASARSAIMAKKLLDRARVLLSQISQEASKWQANSLTDQKLEAALTVVVKRVLQRFQELLEQDKSRPLQTTLSGADLVSSGVDVVHQGPKQRALGILHQIIEDAHNGKRQFLSGKLHNLVKALSDEDDDSSSKQVSLHSDRKQMSLEHGLVLGLGFQVSPQGIPLARSGSGDHGDINPMVIRSVGKRFLGPLVNRPTAYLSAFILYIATVGDIVDGVDTTHDYNFFSLVYERPNDLLTRLVFERGSADAAEKVAEIMGQDLVHQVITACVPPVYPPKAGNGWAVIPRLPSRDVQSTGVVQSSPVPASTVKDDKTKLYVLQRGVIKHLATLSPVRTILACVFGSSRFTMHVSEGKVDSASDTQNFQQQLDVDRWFYEFAIEQSERFPTLNRWIQVQANLQRLSDSPISTKRLPDSDPQNEERRRSTKRMHEPEDEADSDDEHDKQAVSRGSTSAGWDDTKGTISGSVSSSGSSQANAPYSILPDREDEGPYKEAVQGLMEEGKLVDALALADRYLGDGAPDSLLKLLIERGEDAGSHFSLQWQSYGGSHHNLWNSSWQYCIRLRNKKLAATLALRFYHRWELDAAIDVLTMCSCHLESVDPLYEEVIGVKQSLQQYGLILRADSRFSNWREVEALCQGDPEGLALRLASKGAVAAALSVAESFNLPSVTRRELQGRQLVQLLTSDPTTGGGPAEGLRFLGSLRKREDALPVAMAAMEQLPNLRSKQLLVHFFLKRRIGTLSEEEHARLDRLALGLRMLGALPLPWQHRCSALHEHPRLILETLLMWKQLRAASQLLQAFPTLRDNDLIISYAAKAITSSNSLAVERRTYTTSTASKPAPRLKSNFTSGITNLHREARRAFSWTSRDSSSKVVPKETPSRKRKGSMLPPSQKAAWEAMAGIPEEREAASVVSQEGHDRVASVTVGDEWVLTGDSTKDDAVRSSHRYESAPSAILSKALLSLCSDDAVAAKAAVDLCIIEIKKLLCSEQLPLNASSEIIERAFHATEAFVQVLLHARTQLRGLLGQVHVSSTSSVLPGETSGKKETAEESSSQGSTMFTESPNTEKLPELLILADVWLSRVELLQSLLGAGVTASLDDLVDEESAIKLRDRLIVEERYSMAIYTCSKCKIDALPVWDAWGHALLRIENYAQARVKLKQALRLHKGDPAPFVRQIIHTMESGPPVDVSAVRNLYIHMAKSVSSSSDDSLSADSYLNVLHMPYFTKSDRSRRSSEDSADSFAMNTAHLNGEESTRSNLDGVRYDECVYYLQEYARQDLLSFTFQHGRYYDGCLLFFPPDSVPPPPLPSPYQTQVVSSSPQRPDPLATDYGSIDDLCEYCVSYVAVPVLERVLSARLNNQEPSVVQHTAAALTRICNYCEVHRHFNHLYRFQVLKKDYVAAGLCCIQLFLNSSQQEQALRHLERARAHFDDGLIARQQAGDLTKGVAKALRGKLPSDKLTEEELIKFTARINIQMEVVRTFSEAEGPLWKRSLFGNPNDADTFKRRCDVAEALVERNFDLAFQIIYDFGLPAVHIYAGVAASLAERKKSHQLTELLRNIKGTIDDDDWDQVLGAAINVYANRHRERPDRLIDMLSSSHRKVLACVICGRLKSAFQIASKSGSVTDVQYVAHQARQSGTKSVQDLCKQWLAKNA